MAYAQQLLPFPLPFAPPFAIVLKNQLERITQNDINLSLYSGKCMYNIRYECVCVCACALCECVCVWECVGVGGADEPGSQPENKQQLNKTAKNARLTAGSVRRSETAAVAARDEAAQQQRSSSNSSSDVEVRYGFSCTFSSPAWPKHTQKGREMLRYKFNMQLASARGTAGGRGKERERERE